MSLFARSTRRLSTARLPDTVKTARFATVSGTMPITSAMPAFWISSAKRTAPPAIPGVQIADIAGGGMNAAIGILLALFAREKTGQGQYIDISMTDGMVGFLPAALFFRQLTGQEPKRADGLLSHRYACYNTYETADGRYLSIGAVENRFWKQLCDTLDIPEYAPLQYDDQRREEILQNMRKTLSKKPWTNGMPFWPIWIFAGEKFNRPKKCWRTLFFGKENMVVEIEGKDGKKSKHLAWPSN